MELCRYGGARVMAMAVLMVNGMSPPKFGVCEGASKRMFRDVDVTRGGGFLEFEK